MKGRLLLLISSAMWLALTFTPIVRADTIFTVTLNTAPLTGLPGSDAGPFSLAFQLTDGSGTNDGNNTATLSGFNFSGGGVVGSPIIAGGAGGDLSGTVTLTDNDFFNAFAQGFTPGSSLSFLVDLTTNVDAGGVPDAFAFSILDSSGFAIPTMDLSLADTLFAINIDAASPAILVYATDQSRNTMGGAGPAITMDAPGISTAATPVPEPTSLLLVCTGLFGITFAAWRKRDR